MSIEKTLAAIEQLPEVGTPVLRDCAGIRKLLARAEDIDHAAAQVREQAEQLLCILKARLRENWTAEELRHAGLEG